jgi:stage II sporulation protein D (peptidoglycan lytic transglycosylase)
LTRQIALAVLIAITVCQTGAGIEAQTPARVQFAPALVRVGTLTPDGRYSIASVPIEAYVARVVAGEAVRASPPAALEALAIAARTFAVANLGRHRADGFDLCDQTHCQVVRAATSATERAADATAGKLLMKNGVLASIYYTASCGGRTEKPSAVWPGADDPSFLPVQDDPSCQGGPTWSAELHAADLVRALRGAGFRGDRLMDMRITARTTSGRVARLQLDGLQPSSISGQDLRVAVGRAIGWQHVKSTAFELRRTADAYRFDGHGSGHGVGLCVIGSARLAEQGRSAVEILARYFPGLDIRDRSTVATAAAPRPTAMPPVTAALPDDDEAAHASIEKQAVADRDELAYVLGVPPPQITLRFHPTTDAYERATGLPSLRDRGMLDQTIRRGLVHAMVDETLKDRPAWVRHGAALYYADVQHTQLPSDRVACPTDVELKQPVSIGALSNAYARAKACFARQIAAGRNWRDVR